MKRTRRHCPCWKPRSCHCPQAPTCSTCVWRRRRRRREIVSPGLPTAPGLSLLPRRRQQPAVIAMGSLSAPGCPRPPPSLLATAPPTACGQAGDTASSVPRRSIPPQGRHPSGFRPRDFRLSCPRNSFQPEPPSLSSLSPLWPYLSRTLVRSLRRLFNSRAVSQTASTPGCTRGQLQGAEKETGAGALSLGGS